METVTTIDDLVIPTVHLNGTSRRELLQQYHKAGEAVDAAMMALREMTPHGRDYYPQGNEAYAKARAQHADRIAHLLLVYTELVHLADAVSG